MKISIVTVTYNDISGLFFTQDSVCCQTYENIEWIVIDGGTKSTGFMNDFNRINATFKSSEKDEGIYAAMQKGLKYVTGDFVLFLNSGDSFSSCNALSNAVGEMNLLRNKVDIAYFSANIVANGVKTGVRKARKPSSSIWHSVPGNQQATLYSAKCISTLSIPQEYKICGDYALACVFHMKGYTAVHYNNVILSNFSLGGTSTVKIIPLIKDAWNIQINILKLPIYTRCASFLIRLLSLIRTRVIYFIYAKIN